MNLFESISSSFANVLGNKMRSVLTMLGIIIGISAVIMITSVGDGVKSQTQTQLADLGMSSIALTLKRAADNKDSDYLKLSDMEIISMPENIATVVPTKTANATANLRVPGETRDCYIVGTTKDFPDVQPVTLLYGRNIMDIDVQNKTGVCVIGGDFAEKLFGRQDAVGETVTFTIRGGQKQLTVCGISKPSNLSMYFEQAATVYAPISTVLDILGTDRVDEYYFLLSDQSKLDITLAQVNALLSNKHNNTDRYQFQNWADTANQINDVLNQITIFVALVASIALVVGGIGIMNIMLVTVTERTREIGIRKSLGATNANVLFQFLVEAVILTILGGIIGIAIGYLGSFIISQFAPIVPRMSPMIIAGTVAVSSLIGIVFGVYPANKAANLDPIEALRYE